MIFIYKLEDIKELETIVSNSFIFQVRNTFMSYYYNLGGNRDVEDFNLNQFGPIIILEDENEAIEVICKLRLDINKFNVHIKYIEEWILKDLSLFNICVNTDNEEKTMTILIDKLKCKDKLLQKYINNHLNMIRKYNGVKVKFKK